MASENNGIRSDKIEEYPHNQRSQTYVWEFVPFTFECTCIGLQYVYYSGKIYAPVCLLVLVLEVETGKYLKLS